MRPARSAARRMDSRDYATKLLHCTAGPLLGGAFEHPLEFSLGQADLSS